MAVRKKKQQSSKKTTDSAASKAKPVSRTKKKTTKKKVSKKSNAQSSDVENSAVANDMINISLYSVVTIAEVAALKDTLMPYLEQQTAVSIDASEVQMIDTAGLQLLLAFVMQLQSENRDCTIQQPSEVFNDTAKLLGFNEALGLNS